MSRLVAENLTVKRGGRNVLAEVDLTVAPGEIIGIIGPNGAGKTSLLRVLAGIDRSGHGRVALDGRTLETISPRDRAQAIAFLPQPPEAAWPVTVEHLVSLGRLPFARPFGRLTGTDVAATEAALEASGLTGLRHRQITTLSAGEASRAFLGRALAGQPRLLLADEPTANLDPAYQLTAMRVLRRLADGGAGVVMSQHDLPLASRFCDRLLLIGGGRVVALGRPADVLTPRNLSDVFGVVAHYSANGDKEFFAMPWSLVIGPLSDDIAPDE